MRKMIIHRLVMESYSLRLVMVCLLSSTACDDPNQNDWDRHTELDMAVVLELDMAMAIEQDMTMVVKLDPWIEEAQ